MSPYSTSVLCLALATQKVIAFPSMRGFDMSAIEKRQSAPSLPSNIGECNTGVICSTTFDAQDQLVDVSPGSGHDFVAPGTGDLRGPCPGLNAAANHGFLPHNGIATIAQTITGLGTAFNMGADLAGALAAIAVALTGDSITTTWSIGGGYTGSLGLLSNPRGISNSHNKYEGDSSVARGDAYLRGGDATSLVISNFDSLYNLDTNYTLATLREHANNARTFSKANNPYAFYAPFSGLVSTAAHEFVVNFMSNHSAEQPSGYLNRDILKTFFSISGPDNAHVWTPGHEQIPANWYRRPSSNQYDAARNNADNGISLGTYPQLAEFGGNTGTTNSFVGVDPADISGGVFTSSNLLQGNNLGCFTFQFAQAVIPDEAAGLVSDITTVTNMIAKYFAPVYSSLNCQLQGNFKQTGLFSKFPGYKYDQ